MEEEGVLNATKAALIYDYYRFFGGNHVTYDEIKVVEEYIVSKKRQKAIAKNLRTQSLEPKANKKSELLDWLCK